MIGVLEAGEGLVDHHGSGAAVYGAEHVRDGGAAHVVDAAEGEVDGVAVGVVEQALEHAENDELDG